jgi:phosphonate transport system ATP-binding protein
MELMTGLSTSAAVPLVVNIHNVDLARRFAQRIIGMAGGEIVFDGPPEALEPSHLRQIYGGEDWL